MDIDKMKCHEILNAIGEALSPEAQAEWDGMDDAGRNDFLIHAQREDFNAAVKLFEEMLTQCLNANPDKSPAPVSTRKSARSDWRRK